MNTLKRSCSIAMSMDRMRHVANDQRRTSPSRIAGRTIAVARRRRERILACLAFVMLIFAWDATLRLDERVAPPRLRLSHAVERESEAQTQTYVP